MNNWLRIAHDWLLPRYCLLCLGPAEAFDLCDACRSALPRLENPCQGCGTPLSSGHHCGRCLERPPPIDAVRIPFLYAQPVISLIRALKFQHRLQAGPVLGMLLAQHLRSAGVRMPQRIVPVPLHPRRQRLRGFNQSLQIARTLSAQLHVPVAPTLARRSKATAAQSSLQSVRERRLNVRGAFSLDTKSVAAFRHVAIVDDVVTTGATVFSLAGALRRAGVNEIQLWSIARAAKP